MTKYPIILLIALQLAWSAPFCAMNQKFNGTMVYTAEDEYFPYYLDDFFLGSNLTFINKTEFPEGHDLSNSVEEIYNSSKTPIDNELIAIASHEATDGTVHLAILSADDDGEYDINFGSTYPSTFIPDLDTKISLPFYENRYHCYDIQFLSVYQFVIGCINITEDDNGSADTSYTELILVDIQTRKQKLYQFENWAELKEQPDNMKLQLYEPFLDTDDEDINFNQHYFDQTFIIVSFLFEGYSSYDQTSLDVFRYMSDGLHMENTVII